MTYARNPDRLPTLKLTEDEWIALAMAAVLDIGEQPIRDVAMDVLGGERYDRLFNQKLSTPTTKQENHALIRGIFPHIPGKDRLAKEVYIIELGRRVFKDDQRFLDVLAFVKDRVSEFESAGGTIEDFPEPDAHVVQLIGRWYGGVNMSGATVDPDYVLTVTPGGRDWSEAPASWRSGHAGPGGGHDAVAVCAMAYQRDDGTWVGGKYEWHVRPARRRSLDNIRNEYGGWVAPRSGTPVLFWAHTADGNRVSNTVEGVWP